MLSDSELYALWRRKGAQMEVLGEPFRSDFEVSGESENEAPVWMPAPFSRFQGAEKETDFSAISGRGLRELRSAVFSRFWRFCVPAGVQEGDHFGARERFFCCPILRCFSSSPTEAPGGGRRQGRCPLNPSIC